MHFHPVTKLHSNFTAGPTRISKGFFLSHLHSDTRNKEKALGSLVLLVPTSAMEFYPFIYLFTEDGQHKNQFKTQPHEVLSPSCQYIIYWR